MGKLGIFCEFLISSTIYVTSVQFFLPIACYAVELVLCDCATHPVIEKLQSKGIAMHTCGVSVYQKSIKWTWVEPFEMNVKI